MLAAAKAAGCPADQVRNLLRAGVVLQPRQWLASSAARRADQVDGPAEIGYGGARGGGKSHWMLSQMGADDCQRAAGLKCLLLRKVGKALREGFEDLLPRTLGNIGYRWVPSTSQLVFENGSRILLGHFKDEKDVEAYLGLEYDIIGVEEATTLTVSKYKMIRTCNRSSKQGWRPRTYTTTNPGGLGHAWYKQRFIDALRNGGGSGRTTFIPATVRDNLFLNSDYVHNLEDLTGWQRRAWLDGDWDIAAGQFFINFVRDVHVLPAFESLPGHWRLWGALDYGFIHYTVFHLFAQDGDGRVYVVDEHAERKWLPDQHAQSIRGLLGRYGISDPSQLDTIVAGHDVFARKRDATTIADSYAEEGIHLAPANIDRINGAGAMLEGLGDVGRGKEPRLLMTERCARLIEALPAMQHNPARPEDVLKWDADEDGVGGDDAYDSARYGLMEAQQTPTLAQGAQLGIWRR